MCTKFNYQTIFSDFFDFYNVGSYRTKKLGQVLSKEWSLCKNITKGFRYTGYVKPEAYKRHKMFNECWESVKDDPQPRWDSTWTAEKHVKQNKELVQQYQYTTINYVEAVNISNGSVITF